MAHATTTADAGHAEHHEERPGHAHHFDTPETQFSAGKLGMWVFLATEILLFGGLFCAYAVYRALNPEIFFYASYFLDEKLGGINTAILICSSFTMAWGVRAAQLGQKKLLVTLLALTIAGGFGFMGIKYVEYKEKWEKGLLWGTEYQSQADGHALKGYAKAEDPVVEAEAAPAVPAEDPVDAPGPPSGAPGAMTEAGEPPLADPGAAMASAGAERSLIPTAPAGPAGLAPRVEKKGHEKYDLEAIVAAEPKNVHKFFGIYFLMTGLHALHVIIGMSMIAWVLVLALKNTFGPHYYTPVDIVGLYWHLVDLIWIFLFPLLYLIH